RHLHAREPAVHPRGNGAGRRAAARIVSAVDGISRQGRKPGALQDAVLERVSGARARGRRAESSDGLLTDPDPGSRGDLKVRPYFGSFPAPVPGLKPPADPYWLSSLQMNSIRSPLPVS